MKLTFDDRWHRYAIDGKNVPSVTGIENVAAKPALETWKQNQIARYGGMHRQSLAFLPEDDVYEILRKSVYWNTQRAADVGTSGHSDIEAMLTGEFAEPEGYALAAAAFLDDHDIYVLPEEVERRLAHPALGYAGTADVYQPGERVIDWKTKPDNTKLLYPNQGMQLAGYGYATHIAEAFDLVRLIDLPVEGFAVACYPEGEYAAWRIDLTDKVWEAAWFGMVALHNNQTTMEKGWERIT